MDLDPSAAERARRRVAKSASATNRVAQAFRDEKAEYRRSYERFHENIALFSGGTIVLSVTFLGYLKSLSGHNVAALKAIAASWIVLLVALIAAMFHLLFYSDYMHFGSATDDVASRAKHNRTLGDAMNSLEFVNLNADQKITAQSERYDVAAIFEGKRDSLKKLENRYYWVSRSVSWIARCAFLIGLVLLVFFAIENI